MSNINMIFIFFFLGFLCHNLNLGVQSTLKKDNKMSFLLWKKLDVSKWNWPKQDIEIQCDLNKVRTHFHMKGMCLEIKGKHSKSLKCILILGVRNFKVFHNFGAKFEKSKFVQIEPFIYRWKGLEDYNILIMLQH
jgi:hypothetical protein